MIRENQQLLNRLHILSDGIIIYVMLPLAFWLRFYVLPNGEISVPLRNYLVVGLAMTLVQLFTYAAFGLYQTTRKTRLRTELRDLLTASLLDMLLLLSWLFIDHGMHYSRLTLVLFFVLSVGALGLKRIVLRKSLRAFRKSGRNQKHVLIIGGGETARKYYDALQADTELGFQAAGYIAKRAGAGFSIPYLVSCFLQTFYGLADLYIAGRFNGAATLTAVAVGSQLMHMLTVVIVGLAMGVTVAVSRAFGAKDYEKAGLAIGNASILFAAFSFSPVAAAFSPNTFRQEEPI